MEITGKRILGLDLFRALAIILVVSSHGHFILNNYSFNIKKIFNIDGVDLFFVLSGFLIGSILIDLVIQKRLSSFSVIFSFWKRRWFRTIPNYLLILLVNFILVFYGVLDGDIEMFNISFIFFFQNFHKGFYGFYWESWSLSVEEYFYLFVPIILFLLNKFFSSKKAILLTFLIFILFPLFYRIFIANKIVDDFWWDVEFRKVVLTRIDSIMYGVFMAYLVTYYNKLILQNKNLLLIVGVILVITISLIPFDSNSFFSKTFLLSLQPIALMFFLPKAYTIRSLGVYWIEKSIRFISKISYSMYLTNLIFAQLIFKYISNIAGFKSIIVYFMFWSLTILTSFILFKYFESPTTKLRETI